ncbi:hypothetical protein M231_08089 [Tremella mesenterica]|uniref:Nudix hydrolase domain-containing protein n=1 Tax=Tremella mesenterica TaxID=5217 RepID=A0A4Q1BAH1_TREME|nr:hypothetical protein M231_08089 [Tremella mesenterica]
MSLNSPHSSSYYPPAPVDAETDTEIDPAESSTAGVVQMTSSRPITPFDEEDEGGEDNLFRDMTFDEILEELNARFLINLPQEEMTPVRAYWQAEQAHWFYEDYLRPLNPQLPSLSQKYFTELILASSPLAAELNDRGGYNHDEVWAEYCSYKKMVPVCGGILINKAGDKCVMVRGYKTNAGWSFPRGKINSGEAEEACAIREVEEETGFNLSGRIVSADKVTTQVNAQSVTMFIVKDIDESTVFEAQTRMEIGAIEWVKLVDLPTWTGRRGPKTTDRRGQKKFYNVTPFVGPLKRWLADHGINPNPSQRKTGRRNISGSPHLERDLQPFHFDTPTPPHSPTIPAPLARQHSALDQLFTRFVSVQKEGLKDPSTIDGGDNKEGMQRLFSHFGSSTGAPNPEEVTEKQEDDALTQLLGSTSIFPSAAERARSPLNERATKLLSVINSPSKPLVPESPPMMRRAPPNQHQASLLQVLSRPTGAVDTTPTVPSMSSSKPVSLPTSPRPPSVEEDGGTEEERRKRQKALLEMTIAGIGVDMPRPIPHHIPSMKSSPHIQSAQIIGSQVTSARRISPNSTGPPPSSYQTQSRPSTQPQPFRPHSLQPQNNQPQPRSSLPSPPGQHPPPYEEHVFHPPPGTGPMSAPGLGPGQGQGIPPMNHRVLPNDRQLNLGGSIGGPPRPPNMAAPPMPHMSFPPSSFQQHQPRPSMLPPHQHPHMMPPAHQMPMHGSYSGPNYPHGPPGPPGPYPPNQFPPVGNMNPNPPPNLHSYPGVRPQSVPGMGSNLSGGPMGYAPAPHFAGPPSNYQPQPPGNYHPNMPNVGYGPPGPQPIGYGSQGPPLSQNQPGSQLTQGSQPSVYGPQGQQVPQIQPSQNPQPAQNNPPPKGPATIFHPAPRQPPGSAGLLNMMHGQR